MAEPPRLQERRLLRVQTGQAACSRSKSVTTILLTKAPPSAGLSPGTAGMLGGDLACREGLSLESSGEEKLEMTCYKDANYQGGC